MAATLNAKIVLARCSQSRQMFGIRIEERSNQRFAGDWVRTWAFPIDERKAAREKFNANTVTGSMEADPSYPGCPYCKDEGFIQCECGKAGCAGGVTKKLFSYEYLCPWCNEKKQIAAAGSFNVSGGGF